MKDLETILATFAKCRVQSEMEVRSGFILPLLELLGFPLECKAEEFCVYGSEGGKPIPPKPADFLLFSNEDYALHTKRTMVDIDWVHRHSLLVVEAKKPGHLPKTLEQPYYYVTWTKAVAYILTDGARIIARMTNPAGKDEEVINCLIDDLPLCQDLNLFTFGSLIERKRALLNYNNPTGLIISKIDDPMDFKIVTSSDDINLPEKMIEGMRRSCGIDEKVSKAGVLRSFLDRTEAYLKYDIRHDIPQYMIGVPRGESVAFLYADENIAPIVEGEVIYRYANEVEIVTFKAGFVNVIFTIIEPQHVGIYVDLDEFSGLVEEREEQYEKCLRIYSAKTLSVKYFKKNKEVVVQCERENVKSKETEWKTNKNMSHFLVQYMGVLKMLQEHYKVLFNLSDLDHYSGDAIKRCSADAWCLLQATIGVQNLTLYIPEEADLAGTLLEGGTLLAKDMESVAPNPIDLHGVRFEPETVTIYRMKITKRDKRNGYYAIPVGCTFTVAKAQ